MLAMLGDVVQMLANGQKRWPNVGLFQSSCFIDLALNVELVWLNEISAMLKGEFKNQGNVDLYKE